LAARFEPLVCRRLLERWRAQFPGPQCPDLGRCDFARAPIGTHRNPKGLPLPVGFWCGLQIPWRMAGFLQAITAGHRILGFHRGTHQDRGALAGRKGKGVRCGLSSSLTGYVFCLKCEPGSRWGGNLKKLRSDGCATIRAVRLDPRHTNLASGAAKSGVCPMFVPVNSGDLISGRDDQLVVTGHWLEPIQLDPVGTAEASSTLT